MRHLPLLLAFLLLLGLLVGPVATAPSAAAAGTAYAIDPAHSTTIFRAGHLGVGVVYGRFNAVEGSFVLDEANPSASSVQVTIQAASVDTNDAKRDQHLKSPDFFNARQFPTITFRSTKVERQGDAWAVTGPLNLHGVEQTVTIRAEKVGEGEDPWGKHRCGFEGTLTLKRSSFGMTNMLPGIADEVRLTLAVEGVRS